MSVIFQYDIHMNLDYLNSPERLSGKARRIGLAKLKDYELQFDLYSKNNRSAVADIMPKSKSEVLGIIYEVPDYLFFEKKEGERSKMDWIADDNLKGTGNYQKRSIEVVNQEGKSIEVWCYFGTNKGRRRFQKMGSKDKVISKRYITYIINGALQNNLPKAYINKIKDIAIKHNKKYGIVLDL